MAELVRFKDLTVGELADPLHQLAVENRKELARRYLPKTARLLGSDALLARAITEQAIRLDKNGGVVGGSGQETFAVVHKPVPESDGELFGVATVTATPSGMQLFRLRAPVQPRFIDWLPWHWLRQDTPLGHAHLSGWVLPDYYDELAEVYDGLQARVPEQYNSWTIEPRRSNPAVHAAITQTGLVPLDEQRYELVWEDPTAVPPISRAYATPHTSEILG